MKVVRDSKFRHVFGDAPKQKYEDLRLANKATESTGIRGNSKFVCCALDSGGGGTLAVLPTNSYGRHPRDIPVVMGHTGPILDFEFNPFNENMLITASEDTTIKVWQIPDTGLKEHLREPLCTLEGHGKKVSFCTFNPTTENIIASSAFDMTIKIWNLAEQDVAFTITLPEQVLCLKWNYRGSLLAATCKDKKLRIIDPRKGAIVSEIKIHDGGKPSKVTWMGDCNKIVTTGFSQQAERQIAIWDMDKFSEEDVEPLNLLQLDNGTGALYPFFDESTNMLYIAGKGDGNVRYFEFTNDVDPYLHFISQFGTTTPQKGFDFLPKRCMDTKCHEIMKGLKLENGQVQPVSFKVPRKSEAFQEDLYPDCPALAPAMTADEWVSGAEARPPLLQSMRPGEASLELKRAVSNATGVVSVKELKAQLGEAQARIKSLEQENELLKKELETLKGGAAA